MPAHQKAEVDAYTATACKRNTQCSAHPSPSRQFFSIPKRPCDSALFHYGVTGSDRKQPRVEPRSAGTTRALPSLARAPHARRRTKAAPGPGGSGGAVRSSAPPNRPPRPEPSAAPGGPGPSARHAPLSAEFRAERLPARLPPSSPPRRFRMLLLCRPFRLIRAAGRPPSRSIMNLSELVPALNDFASLSLAESWDNVGLLVEPSPPHAVRTLLLTNDLTEQVMEEAVQKNADLILSYHPPIFAPLKRVTWRTWKERLVVRALEHRIGIYSPHTAYDAVPHGVNNWLSKGLGEAGQKKNGTGCSYSAVFGTSIKLSQAGALPSCFPFLGVLQTSYEHQRTFPGAWMLLDTEQVQCIYCLSWLKRLGCWV